MDRRYDRAWQQVEARRQAGEPMAHILGSLRTPELIAALAAVGQRDPVAANVIATELLNRSARAPWLGACLMSATFVVAVFVVDLIVSATPFFVLGEPSSRAFALLIVAVLFTLFSGVAFATWRGHVPRLSSAVGPLRRRRGY